MAREAQWHMPQRRFGTVCVNTLSLQQHNQHITQTQGASFEDRDVLAVWVLEEEECNNRWQECVTPPDSRS